MRSLTVNERIKQARDAAARETADLRREWEQQKQSFEKELANIDLRVRALQAEKEKMIQTSAEALLAGKDFDVSIFGILDGQILQAKRACEIREREFNNQFIRVGPPVVRAMPDAERAYEVVV